MSFCVHLSLLLAATARSSATQAIFRPRASARTFIYSGWPSGRFLSEPAYPPLHRRSGQPPPGSTLVRGGKAFSNTSTSTTQYTPTQPNLHQHTTSRGPETLRLGIRLSTCIGIHLFTVVPSCQHVEPHVFSIQASTSHRKKAHASSELANQWGCQGVDIIIASPTPADDILCGTPQC